MANRPRILTGDRPTGRLHLGHYVGTLENRVRLQDEYECFFIVADLHLLTTRLDHLQEIGENVRGLVLDYLSVGIDPERCTIYLQSLVPEVTELYLFFNMITSVPRVQRIPTLKDMIRDLKIENPSVGLLSYPVLQSADILMVRANLVPVGKDQVSHIELTRETARRFNNLFGPVFPEPEALVGRVPTLPGIDGQKKASKSLGNAIYLSDDAKTIELKVMAMYTDPTHIRVTDPGHTRGHVVFTHLDAFDPNKAEVDQLKRQYRRGGLGDVTVKRRLIKTLNEFLEPIRERRSQYERNPGLIDDIIIEGSRRARKEAQETLELARDAMGINYLGRPARAVPEVLAVSRG